MVRINRLRLAKQRNGERKGVEVSPLWRRVVAEAFLATCARLADAGREGLKMRGLRGLVVVITLISIGGCASKPDSLACAALGGIAGAFAGGAGAAEYTEGNAVSAETVGIGVGSAVVGVGLGYLLCRSWKKKPSTPPAPARPPIRRPAVPKPELESESEPELEPEPKLEPKAEPVPETEPKPEANAKPCLSANTELPRNTHEHR